jgi:tetratricopeptide (TPR) repeat protein
VIAGASVSDIGTLIMRFSPAAIALSLLLATVSSVSFSKRADHEINPQSLSLASEGAAALKAGNKDAAIGWYETALAVDPLNRAAYVALAEIARDQGLKGKAVRMYKEALEIEPNDPQVLADQAMVMLSKGALDPAKKNLARLQLICKTNCAATDALAKAIATAKDRPAVQASAVTIKPTVEVIPPKPN